MRAKFFPVIISGFFFVCYWLFFPSFVLAAPLTASDQPNAITDLTQIFENALAAVVLLGGFAAFIMLIVSGFKYLTSQGDPKAISSAQSSMVWSLVGLAFIIIAWLIILFISRFTGVDVTIFRLKV